MPSDKIYFEYLPNENDTCTICGKPVNHTLVIESIYVGEDSYTERLYLCTDCLSKLKTTIVNHLLKEEQKNSELNVENEFKEYSKELIECIYYWFDYKKTKWKKEYSQKGLKSFFTEIKNQVKATSESVVICKINNSIKSGWMGIAWDSNKFLENDIVEMFEKTWNDLVRNHNTLNKEEAKKTYLYLFRKISTLDVAREYANKIYAFYRKYVDNLSEEKFCMSFANFLKKNVKEYEG